MKKLHCITEAKSNSGLQMENCMCPLASLLLFFRWAVQHVHQSARLQAQVEPHCGHHQRYVQKWHFIVLVGLYIITVLCKSYLINTWVVLTRAVRTCNQCKDLPTISTVHLLLSLRHYCPVLLCQINYFWVELSWVIITLLTHWSYVSKALNRVHSGSGISNETQCYNATLCLFGWAHTQNYPWKMMWFMLFSGDDASDARPGMRGGHQMYFDVLTGKINSRHAELF